MTGWSFTSGRRMGEAEDRRKPGCSVGEGFPPCGYSVYQAFIKILAINRKIFQ
jgi:hypothetical protein